MTPTKHVQLILDEIASRYDQTIANQVWSRTVLQVATYSSSDELVDHSFIQLISIYKVMAEEGFSPSERGSILMTAFESITGAKMSTRAWREIGDSPVYGISQFSHEVKKELWRRVKAGDLWRHDLGDSRHDDIGNL